MAESGICWIELPISKTEHYKFGDGNAAKKMVDVIKNRSEIPKKTACFSRELKMQKAFIITEAGVNHNGDMKFAYKLIDAAVSAQADAVKFQTFISEKNISKKANKAKYQAINTSNREKSQLEMAK